MNCPIAPITAASLISRQAIAGATSVTSGIERKVLPLMAGPTSRPFFLACGLFHVVGSAALHRFTFPCLFAILDSVQFHLRSGIREVTVPYSLRSCGLQFSVGGYRLAQAWRHSQQAR